MKLSDKAAQILRLIAAGKNYEQILTMHPEFSYLDIFRAAEEALQVASTAAPSQRDQQADEHGDHADRVSASRKSSKSKQSWSAEEAEQALGLYYGGYSFSKIASRLDRTPASVKERINATRNAQLGERRELGMHPQDGIIIEVLPGRYGPYVKCGQQFASVPRQYHPAHLTLDEAVNVLAARAERDQDDD